MQWCVKRRTKDLVFHNTNKWLGQNLSTALFLWKEQLLATAAWQNKSDCDAWFILEYPKTGPLAMPDIV